MARILHFGAFMEENMLHNAEQKHQHGYHGVRDDYGLDPYL